MNMMRIIQSCVLITALAWLSACGNNQSSQRKSSPVADLKTASEVNVQLAVGYLQRQQYDVAKLKLDKAIEQDDENVEVYKLQAYLMSIIGKNEEAEDYYEEALDIKSNDPELHNSYGAFLCKLNRIDDALESFRLAYENPFYETAYLAYSNAGTCLIKQEKYTEAESLLRRALQKQPKLEGALISMAEVGVKTKKYLMARAYVQRFHAIKQPTAESLWLQAQSEKALGAHEHYMKVAKRLLNDFPDSHEAGMLDQSVHNERRR